MRLLVVEDNERLLRLIQAGLAAGGFETDGVATAADALAAIRTVRYAALVLDLGLPDADGLVLLKRLRAGGHTLPVLVLTARGGVEDRVQGLDTGADDYLVKPFAQQELLARLRALLRRPGELLGGTLDLGNLAFDPTTREVAVGGVRHFLSPRETAVLELLLRRTGRVVPKQAVEDQLFGLTGEGGANAVEVYVHRLRRELAELGAEAQIHTIRGVGYLIGLPSR